MRLFIPTRLYGLDTLILRVDPYVLRVVETENLQGIEVLWWVKYWYQEDGRMDKANQIGNKETKWQMDLLCELQIATGISDNNVKGHLMTCYNGDILYAKVTNAIS